MTKDLYTKYYEEIDRAPTPTDNLAAIKKKYADL
jgi:hypothetical protein